MRALNDSNSARIAFRVKAHARDQRRVGSGPFCVSSFQPVHDEATLRFATMLLNVVFQDTECGTLRSFGYCDSQSQPVNIFGSSGSVLLFGESRFVNRVQYGFHQEPARRA